MRSQTDGQSWFRAPIGSFAKIQSGGTPSRSVAKYWENGDIPWVTTSEVNYRKISSAREHITHEGLTKSSTRIFPSGTLLVALYGQGKTRGQVGLLAIPAATNQACAAILPDERVSTDYLYYYLQFSYDRLRRLSNTGGQENLSATLISEFIVEFPTRREQHHIVDILRTWDAAIDVLNDLVGAKEKRLRSILEQRAGDARDPLHKHQQGWKSATLGDVVKLVSRRVTWDEDATYRLITVKRACGGLAFRGDRKGSEILTKDMYVVRAGDFVISKRQVVHGAWAMATEEFDGAHVSKEYACLEANLDRLWMPYLNWLSRTARMQHEALICSYGVDIEKMVLNVDWLLQTPILLPNSIETQKSISAGLDCLQQEVKLLGQKKEALQRQKRGLMQRLLTGEWRFSDAVKDGARLPEEAAE
jgi:type I restriction enzyme, S subunit